MQRFWYDANGNMIKRIEGGVTYDPQTFDVQNRLASVNRVGTGTTTFAYDAAGIRVKTVHPGGKTSYFPFPGYEEEVNGSTTTRRITYAIAGQTVALRVQVVGGSNTLYYLHSDHLGSTSLATTTNGAVVAGSTARHLPVGGWRTTPTAVLTDIGFTGHRHNNLPGSDLGLVYMNARFFMPSIGRFASADTIIPNPADPQSYNRYSYALNSPTGLRDASGHCIFAVADTIACLVIAAKIVDYAWTGWDTYQAGRTLADANASCGEKVVAALNMGMAVFFEVVEPDDLLPVGVPLDDLARRAFMHGAEEALEEGGEAGLRAYVKNQIGDEAADTVFNKMDDLLGGCAFNSFQAGTMVMTDKGPVPIEEIQPGDLVLAYNEATGKIGYYPVTDLISHIDIQVVYLAIDGETIVTTAEHPFYTDANTWLDAGELQMGDEIRTATWATGAVEAITIVTQPQRMYNFTVATAHTYFVGDGQWLVHNCPDLSEIAIPGPRNSSYGKLDYLLGRVPGNADSIGKGGLFADVMGFTDETLDSALKSHLIDNFDNAVQDTSRGYNAFIVEGTMTGANGVTRQIRSVWQILDDGTYSFVTAYRAP